MITGPTGHLSAEDIIAYSSIRNSQAFKRVLDTLRDNNAPETDKLESEAHNTLVKFARRDGYLKALHDLENAVFTLSKSQPTPDMEEIVHEFEEIH